MSVLDRPAAPRAAPSWTHDALAVGGAWLLALALTLVLSAYVQRAVFVFFWAAVLVAAWRRGFRTAAVVAVASVLAVDFFLIPPLHALRLPDLAELLTVGIFLVVAGAVSALAAREARARALADEQAQRLQEQAVELELQADSAQATAVELEVASEQLQQTANEAEEARAEAEEARRGVVAILDALSDMVTVMDGEWRVTYLNPAARDSLRALGGTPDAAIGRTLWEIMPSLRDTGFEHETRRAAAERRVVEFEAGIPGTGRWIETRLVPGPDGVLTAFSRDTTDRRRALEAERAAADRAHRLLAVTSGLSGARTPEEVAEVIFRDGLAAVGADAGSLALLHQGAAGPEFELVRFHGYDDAIVEQYRRFPLRAGRPLSDALLTRTPRLVGSAAEMRERYPAVAEEMTTSGYDAFVAVPVMSGGELLGGFSASFREARTFDDATRTFLATLGEQCGLALARARAYASEHETREFVAAILGSVQDGFLALDGALRFTFVNARAEALLRRPAAALIGRGLDEAFPGTGGAAIARAARHVLAAQRPETVETVGPADGTWIEARVYPAPGGLTVFFQDVTARRRARDAGDFLVEATRVLGDSLDYETTLRAVARAAVPRLGDWCAVDVVRDPAHPEWPPALDRLAVVHVDPAMVALGEELSARYPTDWEAEQGWAAVFRERRAYFVPDVTDAMLVGGARDPEHLRLLRALGFRSILAVPLVARDTLLGCLTLATSESGRRFDEGDLALAEDLARRAAVAVDNARLFRDGERSREEAEAANRAKGQFLSTMSHELRTPLNAIAGYTELLEMGVRGPVSDEQREDLVRIRRSAKVLMSLVNDVLNFARIEVGQVEVRLEEVRLDHVLAELEGMVVPQLRAKRLRYTLESVPDCPVRADADRLKQILTNLLTNAVKFTPEGGEIHVSCEVPDPAPAAVGSAPPQVRVRVRDSGRGIPADRLQAIFEPFVQIDRHLTRDSQQGVGLGLAISRELARAMGGELSVESTLGGGSTFTLALPRADASRLAEHPATPPAARART